ncbi:cysteine--tRNA ligase [Nodosilinea sp. LEGE 07088]|uniref:cysteine--tRNA ligase n=1 Tax=Nodosilinea sp. LEGE 07088 TaxID=2777968 RepID=UPI001882171F|nr:cysteine--tRNA ligase [Nodosilinea sp. LEGE 07088]MBE9137843.1 cysteine--tRNA ligase [Nodosilinea sp. LEGE 07088]
MSVVLYNTLTRHKEPLETLEPGRVKMYCCGVTVYDYSHLGHARCYVAWDTVRRYLMWRGYAVHYVQNFTDIDDKILNRAKAEKSSMQTVAEHYTQAYFEDIARLNVMEADEYTYATKTLDGIQRLISELEQKGYAYPANGDVYYAVRKFDGYGKLSGRKLDDMQAGASGRVTAEESIKHDPFDFALWKGAKEGEPFWESPWGPGRPGWHIECSAMIRERLGDTIDIHMGGSDLVFPHHENEIAQSEAATGHPLSKYWMHNGMVNVGGEKMSKSLGNFTTIRDLLDAPNAPNPMAVRLFLLQASYRKPVDFTESAMLSAQGTWVTLLQRALLFGYRQNYSEADGWDSNYSEWTPGIFPAGSPENDQDLLTEPVEAFQKAMDDDFNTPVALAVILDLAKSLNRAANLRMHEGSPDESPLALQQRWITLVELAKVLGLEADISEPGSSEDGSSRNNSSQEGLSDDEVEELVTQRCEARAAKNFAEGDRIRDLLQSSGITLIDKPGGVTKWHR